MTTYKKHEVGKNGWTAWHRPQMKGYKISCCDCGLVHDMDFQVLKKLKTLKKFKDGSDLSSFERVKGFHVEMRVRRNARATGQTRRNREKHENH